VIARWLVVDPLFLADGPNAYVYTRNSPIKSSDPSGLQGVYKPNQLSKFKIQFGPSDSDECCRSSVEVRYILSKGDKTAYKRVWLIVWVKTYEQLHLYFDINKNWKIDHPTIPEDLTEYPKDSKLAATWSDTPGGDGTFTTGLLGGCPGLAAKLSTDQSWVACAYGEPAKGGKRDRIGCITWRHFCKFTYHRRQVGCHVVKNIPACEQRCTVKRFVNGNGWVSAVEYITPTNAKKGTFP
jgi:hypothetical protein